MIFFQPTISFLWSPYTLSIIHDLRIWLPTAADSPTPGPAWNSWSPLPHKSPDAKIRGLHTRTPSDDGWRLCLWFTCSCSVTDGGTAAGVLSLTGKSGPVKVPPSRSVTASRSPSHPQLRRQPPGQVNETRRCARSLAARQEKWSATPRRHPDGAVRHPSHA